MANTRANHPATAGTANIQRHARTATRHVDKAEHIAIELPILGTVQLPRPEQLAYYAAVGVLVALEIIDWPVAVVVAAGHALATQQHNRAIQEFGEGLEIAD